MVSPAWLFLLVEARRKAHFLRIRRRSKINVGRTTEIRVLPTSAHSRAEQTDYQLKPAPTVKPTRFRSTLPIEALDFAMLGSLRASVVALTLPLPPRSQYWYSPAIRRNADMGRQRSSWSHCKPTCASTIKAVAHWLDSAELKPVAVETPPS